MNVSEAVKSRKSVRSYLEKDIDESLLRGIFSDALLAPSARNLQEWRFVVVRDPEMKRKIAQAASNQMFIAAAPVVLVACAETDRRVMRCGIQAFPVDCAIILDHISLLAAEKGLGTCWIGSFNAEAVRGLLGIPEHIVIFQLMPLGYPSDPGRAEKDRKSFDEVFHRELW